MLKRNPFFIISIICMLGLNLSLSAVSGGDAIGNDRFTAVFFDFQDENNICKSEIGAVKKFVMGDSTLYVKDLKHLQVQPRKTNDQKKTEIIIDPDKFDPNAFTIDMQIKFHSDSESIVGTMYVISSSNVYMRYNPQWNIIALECGILTESGWIQVATEKEKFFPLPNVWYKIAMTYDGTEIRLYVDDELQAKADATGLVPQKQYTIGSVSWANEISTELWADISALRISLIPRNYQQQPELSRLPDNNQSIDNKLLLADANPYQQPFVVIPKIFNPPKLDGLPDGDMWSKAAWIGNPVYLNENNITSKVDMQTGLLWDNDALYVGFIVKTNRNPISITNGTGDDGLERDDAVEVTLFVPDFAESKNKPIQFKLNCNGLRDDAIGFNFAWDANWQGSIKQNNNNWSATFKIPFSNFGFTPEVGDTWPANFGTFLVGYNYKAFLWSPVNLEHHHQGNFGRIKFGDKNIPSTKIEKISTKLSSVLVKGYTSIPGKVRVLLQPKTRSVEKAKNAGGLNTFFDDEEGGKSAYQKNIKIDEAGRWEVVFTSVDAGEYLAKVLLMGESDQIVNSDIKPIAIDRSLETRILKHPIAGSISAVVKIYNMGQKELFPHFLSLKVVDINDRVVHEYEDVLKPVLPIEISIYVDKLKNMEPYKIITTVTTEDKKFTIKDEATFQLPPRPDWADTTAGRLNGNVLKPWEPITVNDSKLMCWGRTFDFSNSIFPVSIISQDQEIFDSKMRLVVGSGEKTEIVNSTKKKQDVSLSKTGDFAELRSTVETDLCTVNTKSKLDFDGFLRLDVKIKPKTGKGYSSIVLTEVAFFNTAGGIM